MLSVLLLIGSLVVAAPAQQPTATPAPDLQTAIANLGAFDFDVRTAAARALRRMPPATVAPALEAAARKHADEYVRFRALVLLSGLDTAATTRVAADLMADRNDRLRTVAYQWFERQPRADVLPRLFQALPAETSPFVRPALTRAIAAYPNDPRVPDVLRPLVLRGEDHFRSSVITAVGEHGGTYAIKELAIVADLDGPLQDDAVLALGRVGDSQALPIIAALQKSGSSDLQPAVSAALCLLKTDCPARLEFITKTLTFAAGAPDQDVLLRSAAHALSALAQAGHDAAFGPLLDATLAASGAAREELTIEVGTAILRRPMLALSAFEARQQASEVAVLFRDAFDMLSEDFEEERFGTELRRALFAAPAGSSRRQAAQVLLDTLEF